MKLALDPLERDAMQILTHIYWRNSMDYVTFCILVGVAYAIYLTVSNNN